LVGVVEPHNTGDAEIVEIREGVIVVAPDVNSGVCGPRELKKVSGVQNLHMSISTTTAVRVNYDRHGAPYAHN
jgi:hypothetical protein